MNDRSKLEKVPVKILMVLLKRLQDKGWGDNTTKNINDHNFWQDCENTCRLLSIRDLEPIDFSFINQLLVLNPEITEILRFPELKNNQVKFWILEWVKTEQAYYHNIPSYGDEDLESYVMMLRENDYIDIYDTEDTDSEAIDSDFIDDGFEITLRF
jgi:hypothetical protein